MLDLETLSTRGHASIVVIAALKFNRESPSVSLSKMNSFYAKVCCDETLGLHVDPETVSWWRRQDPELQTEVFGTPREPLKEALLRFSTWYGNSSAIWSQGANFDIPILSEAYSRCGLQPPWRFWTARDTRTLYELAGISSKDLPTGNLHHALHDCWRQVWGVQRACSLLATSKLNKIPSSSYHSVPKRIQNTPV